MEKFAKDVIDFLLESQALKFGEFTLKSGRKAPYFINTGIFADGAKLERLGAIYAQHIVSSGLAKADILFGPAYKGIPLCVATATALFRDFGVNVRCAYDRKEAKDHGEGGTLWGAPITASSRVVIVEDVVTAGTTLQKVIPLIRETTGATIEGIVILVDRCEKGVSGISAVREIEQAFNLTVSPILTIREIRSVLDDALKIQIDSYLEQYGAAA